MMKFESPLDGYFTFLAWNIDLNTRGPFVRVSTRRPEVEDRLGELATGLRREGVKTVHVLAVQLIVPITGGPKYDIALLVHAAEPMRETLISRTTELGLPAPELALTAVNSGRFGDTEAQDGEILLNHFSGDAHPDKAVEGWKTVSAWNSKKLGVDNSTLL